MAGNVTAQEQAKFSACFRAVADAAVVLLSPLASQASQESFGFLSEVWDGSVPATVVVGFRKGKDLGS
jgi:hypothetical protein